MGIMVQRDALQIAQKSLDITGNNISNINTPGYTRQRVDVVSIPNTVGSLTYNTAIPLAGQGARAVGVAQIRDRLLDKKVRVYTGDLCNVGTQMNTISDVEDVFDSIEADELGASFPSIISQFKAALQGFSADHADRSEMANITINSAESLVKCIVNYNKKLDDISERALEDTKKTVGRVNSILTEMGNLNEQIKQSYISMGYYTTERGQYEVMGDYGPLELKDKMNSLLDELSQYGNIHFREESDGTFTVDFADRRVVEDREYAQMAISMEDPEPTELEYIFSKDLMKKDEWEELNTRYGTGGDNELIVRRYPDDVGGTASISDKNTDGIYKLQNGSLRGYLDVYNGRGIYAKGAETSMKNANNALKDLKDINDKVTNGEALTDEDKAKAAEAVKTLETTLGATVTENGGKYSAKIVGEDADGNPVDVANLLDENGAANLAIGGTVSVGGTPNAAITSDDVGGERGADTINELLENLKKVNEQIAAVNDDIAGGKAAEKANEKIQQLNDINTKIGEVNADTTLSDTEKAFRLAELDRQAGELKTSIENNVKDAVVEKADDGTYSVKDKDGNAITNVTKDMADVKDYVLAEYRVKRNNLYEEAARFVKDLKAAGITVNDADKSAGELYTATLKGAALLDGANTVHELSVKPQVESVKDGAVTRIDREDMTGAAGDYFRTDANIVGNDSQGIEYYRDMLNSFVRTVTNEFNGIFSEFGDDKQIFTYGDDFRTAAKNFRVTEFWTKNPEFISDPTLGDNKYEELDNTYINKMLGAFAVKQTYGDGVVQEPVKYSMEGFVTNISDELGTNVGNLKNLYDATDVMLTQEETARSEVMDVGMDEEGISMMNYQKWYNAIARMISTLDEALDKLINGTGIVGLR